MLHYLQIPAQSVNSLGLGGEAKDHQLRQLVMRFSGQWQRVQSAYPKGNEGVGRCLMNIHLKGITVLDGTETFLLIKYKM